jgi:hypothetical protein
MTIRINASYVNALRKFAESWRNDSHTGKIYFEVYDEKVLAYATDGNAIAFAHAVLLNPWDTSSISERQLRHRAGVPQDAPFTFYVLSEEFRGLGATPKEDALQIYFPASYLGGAQFEVHIRGKFPGIIQGDERRAVTAERVQKPLDWQRLIPRIVSGRASYLNTYYASILHEAQKCLNKGNEFARERRVDAQIAHTPEVVGDGVFEGAKVWVFFNGAPGFFAVVATMAPPQEGLAPPAWLTGEDK